ncbi:MAG: DUF882 domain-containing protein [Firmicutes bacterium]|nr:DUF882 domain-containing protein [Bacillota bacterium]
MNDFQLSKNFNLKEFQCTTDNPVVILDPKLIDKLQKLRDRLGVPLHVNSGYRTSEFNKSIGGYEYSKHMKGQAADISMNNIKLSIETIKDLCVTIGFSGIGLYNTHIHVDVGEYNNPNMESYHFWDYRK